GPQSLLNILEKTVDKIEELYQSPQDGITGVSSGYTDLDKMTTGLQPSDLIIVAARPSMGKTTFAMNLAEHAAMTQDKP
ncbi:DnaB-like helicase C-terminal domain-containing protein, partial [Pseudoalteromonas ruthenica]|uniref:DnaB-like helicase C-terminal domain-containing protein n=1 Tax=Pseudoalteromonas ruthenica TaxID=151081 RepID=UPI001281BCA0